MAQMPDVRLARRQAILSCAIIRNIAFYYVGWVSEDGQGTLKDDTELGRTINSNFIDMAVLEWAKLFVDARGRHYWQRFVRPTEARTAFRTGLLASIGLDVPAWEQYHADVRVYRDHFIAHLDDDDVMTPPSLRLARDSTLFFMRTWSPTRLPVLSRVDYLTTWETITTLALTSLELTV
jgi:hypothetical protein